MRGGGIKKCLGGGEASKMVNKTFQYFNPFAMGGGMNISLNPIDVHDTSLHDVKSINLKLNYIIKNQDLPSFLESTD